MGGIVGQGTTYDLPNYTGELFSVSPQDTPFLSAIGGLTGGESVNGNPLFTWQYYSLRDAESDRQRAEGATATAEQRKRYTAHNVVEIHQEAVELSYTKLAAFNQIAGSGSNHPQGGSLPGSNPVSDELGWQIRQQIMQKARDINLTFIVGEFANPADNQSARNTRGLIEAIEDGVTTDDGSGSGSGAEVNKANVTDAEGAALSETIVLNAMQQAWENGGFAVDETRTLLANATQKRALTKVFIKDAGYAEASRNVGGVNVQTIETDFGRVNIMLDRAIPTDTLIIASLEQCKPRFLEIPGKGHFFVEPIAKDGASVKAQLYGEVGLEYGNPLAHALIDGLATTPPVDSGSGSGAGSGSGV